MYYVPGGGRWRSIDVIEDHPTVARWILSHFAREETRLSKQRVGVATAQPEWSVPPIDHLGT